MQHQSALTAHESSPHLLSERLVLRPITLDDAADLQSYRGRDDVVKYLLHEPLSLRAAEARVGTAVTLWQRYPAEWFNANFAVELAESASEPTNHAQRRMIGDLRVWNLLHDGSGPATEAPSIFWLGYAFHPEVQGRGYAREASARVIRWLFDEHAATEVRAIVWAPNNASIGLLEKLGFEVFLRLSAEEETHPKKLPAVHMRLLRADWIAAQNAQPVASLAPSPETAPATATAEHPEHPEHPEES